MRLIVLSLSLVLLSCSVNKKDNEGIPKIVCTTGMIGDAVEILLQGSQAEVVTLMKAGVDPHLYKATQGDVENLMQSDIIVYNGVHLEGKMGGIFKKLEGRKIIIVAADGIPKSRLINNTNFKGAHDPHVWFDVELWSMAVGHIAEELIATKKFDSSLIMQNWKTYKKQLVELDQWAAQMISSIPKSKRTLITSHDAFSYFGKAYDIPVKGLQGISTVSEYGLKDVTNLVNFIIKNDIQAVFIESSVSSRSMRAVVEGCHASGHAVKIGGTLYSDSMGDEGTVDGTYLGMVRHNVELICKELK